MAILAGLKTLPEGWQSMFRYMYGRQGGKRSMQDCLLIPLEQIVDEVEEKNLELALCQVERSVVELQKMEADKPNWAEAPEWADALAQCDYDDPSSHHHKGQWNWMASYVPKGTPGYFINYEKRPSDGRD